MAKIPFDIKYRPQIESGEYKVETEEGSPARIICWDSPIDKERPIIAIVFDDQIEQYKADGHYDNDYETSNYDLFIITPEPEVELSEFEEKVRVCVTENLTSHIKDGNGREMSSTVFIDDDTAKAMAAELLELAKKEIEDELKEKVLHDYWKQVTDGYIQARKEGKAEALKDLPRWKKCEDGNTDRLELEALSKVKDLRDAQNMHAKTLNYGYRCLAIRLGKEVDEMLDKLKIK